MASKKLNKVHVSVAALSKCSVAVGSIAGVVGSRCQAPPLAIGLLVKYRVEKAADNQL